jgi:hypothetical protein
MYKRVKAGCPSDWINCVDCNNLKREIARYRARGGDVVVYKNQSVPDPDANNKVLCCLYRNFDDSTPWDETCSEHENSPDRAAAALFQVPPSCGVASLKKAERDPSCLTFQNGDDMNWLDGTPYSGTARCHQDGTITIKWFTDPHCREKADSNLYNSATQSPAATPHHIPLSRGPKGGHTFSCHRGCVNGVLVDGVHCAYGHTEPGQDVEFGVTGSIERVRVETECDAVEDRGAGCPSSLIDCVDCMRVMQSIAMHRTQGRTVAAYKSQHVGTDPQYDFMSLCCMYGGVDESAMWDSTCPERANSLDANSTRLFLVGAPCEMQDLSMSPSGMRCMAQSPGADAGWLDGNTGYSGAAQCDEDGAITLEWFSDQQCQEPAPVGVYTSAARRAPTPYHIPAAKGPWGERSLWCKDECLDGVATLIRDDFYHCVYGPKDGREPQVVSMPSTPRPEETRSALGGRESLTDTVRLRHVNKDRLVQPGKGRPEHRTAGSFWGR